MPRVPSWIETGLPSPARVFMKCVFILTDPTASTVSSCSTGRLGVTRLRRLNRQEDLFGNIHSRKSNSPPVVLMLLDGWTCHSWQVGGGALLNLLHPPPFSPLPLSSAPLTLLAICDVTLKMHDSRAVTLSMGLLSVSAGGRAHTPLSDRKKGKHTHTHRNTHVIV